MPGGLLRPGEAAAACLATAPPTTYGQVKQPITASANATYRLWSRVKVPDTTANSYYFQIDGGCAYNVGDAAAIPANTWTWINYQDGNTGSVTDFVISTGSHNLTYTGREAGVVLDKIMLVADLGCVPTGDGSNCASTDQTSPNITLTAPTNGATVTGTTTVAADASDASGVKQVDYYLDNGLSPIKSITGAGPYSFSWDTTQLADGMHGLQAKATDMAGNTALSGLTTITVSNAAATPTPPSSTSSLTDTTPPVVKISRPVDGATVSRKVPITVDSTDNTAVTRLEVYIDQTLLTSTQSNSLSFTWSINTRKFPPGVHTITAKAYDAANNVGLQSIKVTVQK